MIGRGSTWSTLMTCFALELERLEQQVVDMFRESVPGLSEDLLPDWERVLGLPDECSTGINSIPERQAIAHTKYTANYTTLNAAFYEQYAADLGSTIVLQVAPEGNIFRVDENRVDRTPAEGIDGARLGSIGTYAQWVIEISASDPNKDYLKCYFSRIAPAHVRFIWVEV